MIVNLECVDCGFVFDSELGNLHMDKIGSLIYEKKPICPKCKSYDRVYMTESGFNQLNKWFLDYLKRHKQ